MIAFSKHQSSLYTRRKKTAFGYSCTLNFKTWTLLNSIWKFTHQSTCLDGIIPCYLGKGVRVRFPLESGPQGWGGYSRTGYKGGDELLKSKKESRWGTRGDWPYLVKGSVPMHHLLEESWLHILVCQGNQWPPHPPQPHLHGHFRSSDLEPGKNCASRKWNTTKDTNKFLI